MQVRRYVPSVLRCEWFFVTVVGHGFACRAVLSQPVSLTTSPACRLALSVGLRRFFDLSIVRGRMVHHRLRVRRVTGRTQIYYFREGVLCTRRVFFRKSEYLFLRDETCVSGQTFKWEEEF